MKLTYTLLLCAVAIFFGCTNSSQNKTFENVKTEKIKSLPTFFYKRLVGTIAGKQVIIQLNQTSNYNTGSYYYVANGREITLSLDTVINADSLILNEYIVGDETGKNAKIHLKWTGNGFKGNFAEEKGKSYAVELTEEYPQGSYRFETDSLTEKQNAFTKPDGPKATIKSQYLIYTGKNEAWVNNNIKTIAGITNNGDWKTGLKTQFVKYFSDYKNDVKELLKYSQPGEDLFHLNYESIQSMAVRFNQNDFVVIEHLDYAYTGGAHGNYGSGFYNFDIAGQRNLKLSDILTADTTTLNKIGETYLRKQFNLKPKEALSKVLFSDDFKLNDNFFINSKGISFSYNPYEIASYAQGQVIVFIPYEALKAYLNAGFKQRMGIK